VGGFFYLLHIMPKAKSGVPAAALGAGYVTFFFYSAGIGAVGIVLAFLVAARQPKKAAEQDAAAPA
jgi:PAT family beta-lactamase induction signal transducer AmpG